MLDYLVREDIFPPSSVVRGERRGRRRLYTYTDVVLLRVLSEICTRKGKIKHLKDALLKFRMAVGPMAPGVSLKKRLFVDGDELCLYTPDEGARVLRSGQMTFAFVVDLADVSREIADCVVLDRDGGLRLTDEAAELAEQKRQESWTRTRLWRERQEAA